MKLIISLEAYVNKLLVLKNLKFQRKGSSGTMNRIKTLIPQTQTSAISTTTEPIEMIAGLGSIL